MGKSSEEGQFGAIHRVIETIKVPTMLRIRWEDPNSHPIKATYYHVITASILDSNDNPLSWIIHKYEAMENGTRLRTTFRLPARVPKWFIKALHLHNIEEIGKFPEFLPELYEKNKKIKKSILNSLNFHKIYTNSSKYSTNLFYKYLPFK